MEHTLHSVTIEDSGPWYSQPTTKQWAHTILPQLEPPPLLSQARVQCRNTIAQHEELIVKLAQELNERQTQVLRMKVTLAPFRLIPPEILSVIFIHARPPKFEFADGRQLEHPALSVCRLWRQVALNTPQLWAHFQLTNVEDHHRPFSSNSRPYRSEKLLSWVRRAKAVPWVLETNKYCREEYWDILSFHLNQWANWTHSGRSHEVLSILQRSDELIRLRELTFNYHHENTGFSLSEFPESCQISFPVLRKLRMELGALHKLPPIFAPQLRELYIVAPQPAHLDHAAKAYPELESLEIRVIQQDGGEPEALKCSEVFPKLKTFYCAGGESLSTPLTGMMTAIPNITSMTLCWVLPGITLCKLKDLTTLRLKNIDKQDESESLVAKLIEELVPELKYLELISCPTTSHILHVLTPSNVCPKLKQLYIQDGQLDRKKLHKFAKQRANVPRSKYAREFEETKSCRVTLRKCRYPNCLELPDIVDAGWGIIGSLRSTRTSVESRKKSVKEASVPM